MFLLVLWSSEDYKTINTYAGFKIIVDYKTTIKNCFMLVLWSSMTIKLIGSTKWLLVPYCNKMIKVLRSSMTLI